MNHSLQTIQNLRLADRVIIPKSDTSLIRHHGIYWGADAAGQHWLLHNHPNSGVSWITWESFFESTPAHLVTVQPFLGNEWQRQQANAYAQSKIGTPYDVFYYNCEHYSNEVQYRRAESLQVGKWLSTTGLVVASFLLIGFVINK